MYLCSICNPYSFWRLTLALHQPVVPTFLTYLLHFKAPLQCFCSFLGETHLHVQISSQFYFCHDFCRKFGPW